MEVKVSIAKRATPELAAGLSTLLPQLLGHDFMVTVDRLNAVLAQPGVNLFVAMLGDKVVGTAQLSLYELTFTSMAWVDGVVVDANERGKGIAGKLMQALMDTARERGLSELRLTSNPKREAANHLYKKLGFEQYETNYYRYKF